MKRFLALISLLAAMIYLQSAPISPQTHAIVMLIAEAQGVPQSVADRLQIEESGDRYTGTWGDAHAHGPLTTEGYRSYGLFGLYAKPSNLAWLLAHFFPHPAQTFDIFDPIQNAVVGLGYLAWLHRRFGTWYLAACAYNAGPSWVVLGAVACEERFRDTREYARRIIEADAP